MTRLEIEAAPCGRRLYVQVQRWAAEMVSRMDQV
jgi:hypothetical protein